MLQTLGRAIATEVVIDLKRQAQRIHFLMALPAVFFPRLHVETLTECFVMVFRDHRVHGNRHIGNGTSE